MTGKSNQLDGQKARVRQHLFLVAADLAATLASAGLAFTVRFAFDDRSLVTPHAVAYLRALLLIIPLRVVIYHRLGLYRQVWSLASLPELARIAQASTVDTAASWLVLRLLTDGFPRSVILISWFTTTGALGAVRLLARLRYEWRANREAAATAPRSKLGHNRTLVFGAGCAGALLARELVRHPELGLQVVGFIDDDAGKIGQYVAGRPVFGTRAQLADVVRQHDVTQLIIAVPSADARVVRETIEIGRELGLQLKTIPGIYELVGGRVSVSQIRDVQIEDLLGRPEVRLDLQAIAEYLAGECVLVTGAGGSIGSELCRQVSRFRPRQVLLLGHGENSIYEIDRELRLSHPDLDIIPIIADIQDEARIWRVFRDYRPDVVFHAAAHKHVPLMEQNPAEAIKNNVFGTLNVVRAADFYNTKRFVLISTDKAVNPRSVMGATKRAAEQIIQAYANSGSETAFVAVRFGNVLGSRGSVVPLFKRQIAAGGPVTVTHPDMTRYFMTIPEAAQLVVQAASMGSGGEVFVLDMGSPVRIDDLARDMIKLSGLRPGDDISIEYTGLRPGEKLSEDLFTPREGRLTTRHERVFTTYGEHVPMVDLEDLLDAARELVATGNASNDSILALKRLAAGLADAAVAASGNR